MTCPLFPVAILISGFQTYILIIIIVIIIIIIIIIIIMIKSQTYLSHWFYFFLHEWGSANEQNI
jgi:hypothetical protein